MTATVADDAELGFISSQELRSLLREEPELCQQLLTILGAKIAKTEQASKAMVREEHVPPFEMGLA